VSVADPITWLGAIVVSGIATLLAAAIPAREASLVLPGPALNE
jgi:hypothetical protein